MSIILTVDDFRIYRWIFYAAAVYNAIWGVVIVAMPNLVFDLLGMVRPNYSSLWQCIGMMVGVFAIGYWLLARDPVRYGPIVWIGLLGKVFGPVGLLMSASSGELPWSFGWVCLTNDVIWWIPFGMFLWHFYRKES